TSVVVPRGVTAIEYYAFNACYSLKSIVLPDGVAEIGDGAFDSCSSLASIDVPKSVTRIGENAFWGCSSLASFNVPAGAAEIGGLTFQNCPALPEINVAKDNARYRSIDGVLFSKDGKTLVKYPEGKKAESYRVSKDVAEIEYAAFANAQLLESIDVADSNPNYRSVDGVLFSKDGKTLVQFPAGMKKDAYAIPKGVATLGIGAFYRCSSLRSIDAPRGITELGEATFEGCSALTSINIPEGITEIGEKTFADCSALTAFVVPDGVKVIEHEAFEGCESLKLIVIPASVEEIDSPFEGRYSLTIRAPKGSNAEEFATKEGINFESLE
ncbi:MAG: leucine-rich repeat domain-containing protein, partial [Thermoguttaceae bacterium]|nr:leucine-rich repeat domain-containing protein [Thermoguttaceae bacterium]